ncbi:MAG: NAD(P)H-hydrate epimerase, partial [Thermoproteota archaeon]
MNGLPLGFGDTITSRDVAVIDTNSEALGVTRLQLMENAGRAVALEVHKRLAGRRGARVTVFAGPGGNGGDGLAAARHLAFLGYQVEVLILARPGEIRSEEARRMYEALEQMDLSVNLKVAVDPGRLEPVTSDVVIDAILGVGLRGAPRSPYKEAIEAINKSEGLKVAVDVPSGLDSDTGEAPGAAVRADVTVTLHKPKPGLAARPDLTGEVVVYSIGAPPEAEIYVGPGDVLHRYPRRS